MTKAVRIENADQNNSVSVVVQVWDKGLEGQPDILVEEQVLQATCDLSNNLYVTSTRYLVIKERVKEL